jgi:hypothetical protein
MYNVSKETAGESTYIPVTQGGILENFKLESVTYASPKKDGSGDFCLIFDFKGPNGEQFRHVEFPILATDKKAQSKAESLAKRIKHILNKFVPEEKIILSGSTFEQFAKGVLGLLGNTYKTVPVRVKIVYNPDNQRFVFTKYIPFIERMDVTPTKLSIGKDEIITKPAAPTAASGAPSVPDEDKF